MEDIIADDTFLENGVLRKGTLNDHQLAQNSCRDKFSTFEKLSIQGGGRILFRANQQKRNSNAKKSKTFDFTKLEDEKKGHI
jgi:hypothetical protein